MYKIIVNPNSKCGRGRKVWRKVEDYLKRNEIPYERYLSEYPGHVSELAAGLQFPEGLPTEERVVVVIGGDGTLNETINGLKNLSTVTIGYIPAGSGNDFARNMNIPSDPIRACRLIFEEKKRRVIDYGVNCMGAEDVHSRRFAVSTGIGFDAAICHDMENNAWKVRLNKLHLGKLVYIVCGIRQIVFALPTDGELILDGKKKIALDGAYFLSVHNLETEGGGFRFGKNADPADGKLTVCVFQHMCKYRFVMALVFTLLGGHQTRVNGVRTYSCSEAVIHMENPMPAHTDGECGCMQKVMAVSCVKNGLSLFC